MNRAITLVLLAFGLAAFTLGQSVSETSQGKAENRVLVQATASPGSLDFCDQVVETMSKQLRVTLTNKTDKPIQVTRVHIVQGDWEDFEADDDPCTGVPIEAGESCSIGVMFNPNGVGVRSSFLAITYDDEDHPQTIPVKGNGIKAGSTDSSARGPRRSCHGKKMFEANENPEAPSVEQQNDRC